MNPATPAGAALLDGRATKPIVTESMFQIQSTCYCKNPGREGGQKSISKNNKRSKGKSDLTCELATIVSSLLHKQSSNKYLRLRRVASSCLMQCLSFIDCSSQCSNSAQLSFSYVSQS
eukprot:scaffold13249_cov70-Skeletonema_dohrnii-CCMP3373.AAC.1